MIPMRHLIAGFVLSLTVSFAQSQNLEAIGDEAPFKIGGSLNATTIGYGVNGISSRRDPFNWFLTGNMNVSIYGWNIPFSISYSNQNTVFRQPFNQYGISPQYKWVKTYIGYQNLTYSSYTLAGHVFLGSAVELTPGKFHTSIMYGRLNKAVEEDTLQNTVPSFKRMGYAVKIGYGDNQNSIDMVIFHARDDMSSLTYVPVKSDILPMENLVLSLSGRKKLTERVSVFAEAATSAVTRDTRAEKSSPATSNLFSYTKVLFKPRNTSEYYNAVKSSLIYTGTFYALQLNYERIDPGYQTLGAYFFNNDLRNITVSSSVKLLKDKLDLSGNFGTQRNNLDDTEVSAVKRVVGSVNANFNPDNKWSLSGSYSNFTTFTNVRPRFDPFFNNDLDTLNFYQLNQNATGSVGYNFGTKEIKRSVFFNGSYQVANETSSRDTIPASTSNFYSGNLAYRYAVIPGSWSASLALNVNKSILAETESLTIGPNLILTKAFFQKKLRCSVSSSYNYVSNDGILASKVITLRANGNYVLEKTHTFSVNLATLKKFAVTSDQKNFIEFTGTLNYGYTF